MTYDSPDLGRSPRISDFVGNSVSLRRADGSLINIPINPLPSLLHKYKSTVFFFNFVSNLLSYLIFQARTE